VFQQLGLKSIGTVEMIEIKEFNSDQRREAVNTQQRYAAYREAEARASEYRGSMIWTQIKGRDYLLRSHYDKHRARRQISLGPRSQKTETIKREYESGRSEAQARLKNLKEVMARQAAINRAIGLGRVPLIGAKIIRALEQAAMLGSGIRVLGTNAIYAYEAAAGVRIDPGLTTTEDIDLLFDASRQLTFIAEADVTQPSLLPLLQKVDRSFSRSKLAYRAVNRNGYLVDLLKPLRNSPSQEEKQCVGANAQNVFAAEIKALSWDESSSMFEAVAIDERGEPCRIVTTDPRVWVAHKFWLSKHEDREPVKRRRDETHARAVGRLVKDYMPHLHYASEQMKMLPKSVFEQAAPLFR
jgi:hypothetical protein